MKIFGIFAINGIEFSSSGAFCEKGAAEEGSEAEECLGEAVVDASVHFKVVYCFLCRVGMYIVQLLFKK